MAYHPAERRARGIGGPSARNPAQRGSLHPEAIELSVLDASDEGVPFVRCEPENRAPGVPAVANANAASWQVRYLDAIAVGEAQRALDPGKT